MSIQRWSVAKSELCPVGEESVTVMLAEDVGACIDDVAAYDKKMGGLPGADIIDRLRALLDQ